MKEEQVFENGKMWLAADGSLWCSSLADALVVLCEEWRSEASFSGAGFSCCTLCIIYWHALHAGHIFSQSAVDLRYEIMNPGSGRCLAELKVVMNLLVVVEPWQMAEWEEETGGQRHHRERQH